MEVELLKQVREDVYKDLPEGWYAGPWGTCEMCKGDILDGEIGYRTRHGFCTHRRCMAGIASSAPADDVEGIKDEIKEMLNA